MPENIQSLLQEVWDICKRARVVDDREIIEYIAVLLLEIRGIAPLIPSLRPRRPSIRYGIDEEELKSLLRRAGAEVDNDFGRLFDSYVLFQSSKTAQRGSYPIPRHIITFMLEILDIQPGKSFADFACGSGGFLVHRYRQKHSDVQKEKTVGVDIAPAWTRIANANASLNGLPAQRVEIYDDDAFHACGPEGVLNNRYFDCIAMAPSFGKASNEKTAMEVSGRASSSSNETLFTRLMVEKLSRSGKGIIMVPNGLLSRTADRTLRRTLVEDHALRAVISLQSGMLYPFNDEQVGLIFVQKQPLSTPPQPWFFRVEQDGYSLTRSRDVTQEPSLSSDMPLIVAAMNHSNTDYYDIPVKQNSIATNLPTIRIKWLSRPKGRDFLGMLVQIAEQTEVISVRLVSKPKEGQNYLIAEVKVADQNPTFIILLLAQRSVSKPWTDKQFSSRDECIKKIYAPETPDPREIPEVFLFRSGQAGQTLVFSSEGRLVGISEPRKTIVEAGYNLHPDRYLPQVEVREFESRELTSEQTALREMSAAVALDEIKRRQAIIRDYADNLLGRVEMKPLVREQLPPRIIATNTSSFPLLPYLGKKQRDIWEHLLSHKQYQSYALYFRDKDLYNELSTTGIDFIAIQQTLDLLIRLGLVVQVMVCGPGTETAGRYYRLVTEQDQPVSVKESESL